MELLKFLRYVSVVCIFFTLLTGRTSAIQLCHHGQVTTHLTNLNMTSSPISRSNGMCSCRIELIDDARLTIFADMTVPGCNTSVSLSDLLFDFRCSNGKVSPVTYLSNKTKGDELWLFVTSTSVSQAITGNLQIKTSTSSQFRLECFDANTNTSETTPNPGTTTTLATTRMSKASTNTTLALKTQTLQTSITSTTSPLMAASTIPSAPTSSTDGPPVSASGSAPANSPSTSDKIKEFPVAAVAGGIAGGLLLILIVTVAVVCFSRRRNRGPKLLENGEQPSTDQGNDNRAIDSDRPTPGEIKPQDIPSPDNTKHVHVENDLYVSAGTDNQPHHPQVDLASSAPGQYASTDDLNIEKSEVESVEGSEVVITSSGDLYAFVDESKKNQDQLVTDPNPNASLVDLYAVVDPTMKHQDEPLFDSNPTQDDEYAVVNKKQDPQDIDPASIVSPSGDVYSVVNKKQDPQDLDPTSIVTPSGDVYAVVNKKHDPQDLDTTHTFSPFGDVDKKSDPEVIDPNHITSPSGDVYAVVEKKLEADQNDHMASTATDDAEEEAIRRVMDMDDERPSSDTLQSTSL